MTASGRDGDLCRASCRDREQLPLAAKRGRRRRRLRVKRELPYVFL